MELPRVEAAFVKDSDIPDFKSLKEFEMYQAVCTRFTKESLLRVQRLGMLWRLYLNDKESRVVLLANKITLRGQTVNVFFQQPKIDEIDENVVKTTLKDLPISKGNNGIEQYLISNGIKLRTKIQYAKARAVKTIAVKCAPTIRVLTSPDNPKCRHFCFIFDIHNYCPTCREAGKGDGPCVTNEKPCNICSGFTEEQLIKIKHRRRYVRKQKVSDTCNTSKDDDLDLLGDDMEAFSGSQADLEGAAKTYFHLHAPNP